MYVCVCVCEIERERDDLSPSAVAAATEMSFNIIEATVLKFP